MNERPADTRRRATDQPITQLTNLRYNGAKSRRRHGIIASDSGITFSQYCASVRGNDDRCEFEPRGVSFTHSGRRPSPGSQRRRRPPGACVGAHHPRSAGRSQCAQPRHEARHRRGPHAMGPGSRHLCVRVRFHEPPRLFRRRRFPRIPRDGSDPRRNSCQPSRGNPAVVANRILRQTLRRTDGRPRHGIRSGTVDVWHAPRRRRRV